MWAVSALFREKRENNVRIMCSKQGISPMVWDIPLGNGIFLLDGG